MPAMSEQHVIEQTTAEPATTASVAADLARLESLAGATVLVHSSLSSLGWVCGGPVAVVDALLTAVGPSGTVVMPTYSGQLSEPAQWQNPPVPEAWWPTIRAHSPPFDPATTPTRGMGAIVEVFRDRPEVRRSHHPQTSFAARGPQAAQICDGHQLAYQLGEASPLARLHDADACVLLLGVGHAVNTSLHLAEYRSPQAADRRVRTGLPVTGEDGESEWLEVDDVDSDASDFPEVGAAFEAAHPEAVQVVGVAQATARLLPQRSLVDFAVDWFARHR